MRLWQRLLRRAGWPLRFSEGFNVRPRMSLLLPRPVGTTSDDDRLRVGLTPDAACGVAAPAAAHEAAVLSDSAPDVEALSAALAAVLPDGIALLAVRPAESKADFRVEAAEYLATLPEGCRVEPDAVAALLAADRHLALRTDERGAHSERDIRPFIQELTADGRQVRMRLAVTDSGSARPTEVLVALGVPEADLPAIRLHRTRTICAADMDGRTGHGDKENGDCPHFADSTCEPGAASARNGDCPHFAPHAAGSCGSQSAVPAAPVPPPEGGPQE